MESNKIVHVHLKNPHPSGIQDYYFGSLKAIYDILTKEDIGRSYASLTANSIYKNGGIFENAKCTIRISDLIRSKQRPKE